MALLTLFMKFKYWLEDTEGRLTHFYLDNSGSLVELSLDYLKPSLLLKEFPSGFCTGTLSPMKDRVMLTSYPYARKNDGVLFSHPGNTDNSLLLKRINRPLGRRLVDHGTLTGYMWVEIYLTMGKADKCPVNEKKQVKIFSKSDVLSTNYFVIYLKLLKIAPYICD
ncbi:hypothetical protein OUZ56_020584 [Daphnia magna]|uniref:Uncharacterized protein n=1 Tax=Daphnia magna TaxID=35525 RepID=A0ABQ9ZEV3_9CRUS|nr:hypothetical protein OUZ56_020584 [Daphnia magna]